MLTAKITRNVFKSACYKSFETKQKARLRVFSELPGPEPLPFFGTLHKYLPGGEYSFNKLHMNALKNFKKYGILVKEEILPNVMLLHVFDPIDIETVFRNEGRYPERRSHLALDHYRTNKSNVYNSGGLLAVNGSEWYRLRSNFQKSISVPKVVKSFIKSTDEILSTFIEEINKLSINNCIIPDFLPELNRLYLEIIVAITFGRRLNSFSEEERDDSSETSGLIEAAFQSNSGILKLDQGFLWKYFETPLYRKLKQSQTRLEKFAVNELISKTTFYEEFPKEDSSCCLVDSFLKQSDVDFKDIVGMCVDILMAAIDTTSYSTSFFLYHLANNPEVQEKVFEECQRLLPDKSQPITDEVLSQAQFLKACMKESLRLNPVSVGVGRIAQNDFLLRDFLIPKGTVIVTHNMTASRLYQYCDDPLQFIPERWLRDSPKYQGVHPYLSLPFGFGPRSCVASRLAQQNIALTVMKIIRNFKIVWIGGEMDVVTLLINKPNRDVTISFVKRK